LAVSSVAEQLRSARESQGLSLRDLADMTKIRSDYLQAIESADYSPFPAPVYIRGSIRTYASFLKLDVAALLNDLDRELSASPEHREPPSLTGERRGPIDALMYHLSRVNWRWVGGLALIALIIGGSYSGWRAWEKRSREDPLSRLGPGLYQPSPISEGDLLPLPLPNPTP
jgi:cytoskeleton protein RodZ